MIDKNRKRVYSILNIDKDSVLHAMSLETGKTLWTEDFERYLTATPALLTDGSVVVADMKGVVHAISPEGNRRDRYHTGADYLLASPVCDAKGRVFVGDPQGRIHGIEPNGTGEVLFEAERAIQARPAFDSRGWLYVPSTDRYVYVFPSA